MATVEESQDALHQLGAGLQQGVETLSEQQTLTFTLYVKLILPLDGYVFWVKASLLTQSALFNALRFNSVPLNKSPGYANVAQTVVVKGSLHYATQNKQDEDKTIGVNYMIFTAQDAVNDLNAVGSHVMYIAEHDGLKFAFNRRESFYKQAAIWHYRGDAVYSTMQTQLIDSLEGFDSQNVIVSNSLPIWLALDRFMPVYPSFLVDQNVAPPFAAVHIAPGSTIALAQAPWLNSKTDQFQLVEETVKIDLWGTRNFNALDYVKYLMDDSLARPSVWGIMDMPVVQDEKITQSELNILGMRKTFTMQVNYYQQRVRNLARQLILSAFITYHLSGA